MTDMFVTPILWERRAPVTNQGSTGSCTGHCMAGVIGTDGRGRQGDPDVGHELAMELYELATRIDQFPGEYPAQDTGSSAIAVVEAAKQLGYVKRYWYSHFVQGALSALWFGPLIAGVPWYSGCERPGKDGLVSFSGDYLGGHAVEVVGWEPDTRRFVFYNSRGPGFAEGGLFRMSLRDFGHALWLGGSVVLPIFPQTPVR